MSTTLNLTEVRHGSASDIATVNAIMADAFDPRWGEAWTGAQCLGMLSLPGVWLLLARIDGEDAGFALARATLDDGELLLLATRPASRGRGVGTALLRATIAEAEARGVRRVHLEVRAGNQAIHLYGREGFAKVGERRQYYRGKGGQLIDAHTYARDVT